MLNIYTHTYIGIMIFLQYWNNVMYTCVLESRLAPAAYCKSILYFPNNICTLLCHICRATTRPPRPSSTAECLRLIARLRGEQASAASWEPRPPFEVAEMD